MKEIQNIYSVVNQLTQVIQNQALVAEVQNLSKLRTPPALNAPNLQNTTLLVLQIVDRLVTIFSKVQTEHWTSDHEYVAEKLGLDKLIGEKGRIYFDNIKKQLQTNPANLAAIVQSLYTDINAFRVKPTQFLSLLQPFELESNLFTITEDEGVIEITFDGGVTIDNFKNAKDQMSDWFLIIEGYARLASDRREDFEIINISKNSPVKFKIKTTLKNTVLILGIVSSLLTMEKKIIESRLMIERLKQYNLVPDEKLQKEFIEKSVEHINERITSSINEIVEEKLKEYDVKPEDKGDIKTILSKSVQNQYNFIINGGDVSIQVLNGEVKLEVKKLEESKNELKQIKVAFENQKALTSGNSSNNPDSANSQTN